MKKFSYLVVPMGLLFSSVSVAPEAASTATAITQEAVPVDLRTISGHLSSLKLQAPQDLDFAGQLVPLDRPHVAQKLNRELRRHQYYYASNLLVHKRATRYEKVFKRILRQHGVPEDFFYLSIAESVLSNAISPVGAKGFWQFMPATARHYGLEVSATVDERYHPEKAAHAAAYYLKDAYERFGDWTLVAASYNMGQAGVARQVHRQDQDDYYELSLNQETGKYLYRILTYKVIMEHPQLFGLQLSEAEMYAPITYRAFEIDQDIEDLQDFAREKGTTLSNLKRLNPWLVSDRLDAQPDKTYDIRIPVSQEFLASELEVNTYYIDIPSPAEEDSLPDSIDSPAPIALDPSEVIAPLDSMPIE